MGDFLEAYYGGFDDDMPMPRPLNKAPAPSFCNPTSPRGNNPQQSVLTQQGTDTVFQVDKIGWNNTAIRNTSNSSISHSNQSSTHGCQSVERDAKGVSVYLRDRELQRDGSLSPAQRPRSGDRDRSSASVSRRTSTKPALGGLVSPRGTDSSNQMTTLLSPRATVTSSAGRMPSKSKMTKVRSTPNVSNECPEIQSYYLEEVGVSGSDN